MVVDAAAVHMAFEHMAFEGSKKAKREGLIRAQEPNQGLSGELLWQIAALSRHAIGTLCLMQISIYGVSALCVIAYVAYL